MCRMYTESDRIRKELHALLFPSEQTRLGRVIKNIYIAPLAFIKYIKAR